MGERLFGNPFATGRGGELGHSAGLPLMRVRAAGRYDVGGVGGWWRGSNATGWLGVNPLPAEAAGSGPRRPARYADDMATPENNPKAPESAETDGDFLLHDVFPNAASILGVRGTSPAAIKADAVVVFDTNALLTPYLSGQKSLNAIGDLLRMLKKERRLAVPTQVMREFAKHRPQKLGEMLDRLLDRNSKLSFERDSSPLLEPLQEYKELKEAEESVAEGLQKCRESIRKMIDAVKSWTWNDPVTVLYADVFTSQELISAPGEHDEGGRKKLQDEWRRRASCRIPPGYKDARKETNAPGDFLVWAAVLEMARTRKKPTLLVTGEQKGDWWHRTKHGTLYPRFELQVEYQQASGGAPFAMLNLSDLTELFSVDHKVVEEVREAEERAEKSRQVENPSDSMDAHTFEMYAFNLLSGIYPQWKFIWHQARFDFISHPHGQSTPLIGVECWSHGRVTLERAIRIGDLVRSDTLANRIDRFLLVVRGCDREDAARLHRSIKLDNPSVPIGVAYLPGEEEGIRILGDNVFA